jgi:tetratricopeptide (TPR) repeat protein
LPALVVLGLPVWSAAAVASPQQIMDSGLVVLVRTAGGGAGSGMVVGTHEVATSCSVLAGATSITVHETWKQPVVRTTEGVPAIVAARDVKGLGCLLFLEAPFWTAPPVEFAPARDIAALLESSAEWRACLLSPTSECVLDEAGKAALGNEPRTRPRPRHAPGWGVENVAAAWRELGNQEKADLLFTDSAVIALDPGYRGAEGWLALALVQFETGDEEAALESLAAVMSEATREWDEAYGRIEFYGRAAAALVEAGAEGAAGDLADEALRLAKAKDGRDRTLRGAAMAQCNAGQVGAAVLTAEAIVDPKERAFALRGIGRTLAESGDLDGAYEVVERIADPYEHSFALAGISQTLAKSGDLDGAYEVTQRIVDATELASTLGSISYGLVRSGDLDGAHEAAQRIVDPELRSSAFRVIGRTLAESGDLDGAYEAAHRMVAGNGRTSLLGDVVAGLVGRGEAARALGVARESSDMEARGRLLAGAAESLAEAGKVREALETAFQIEDSRYRVFALHRVASHQAASGDHEGALRTVERLRSSRVVDRASPSGYESSNTRAFVGALSTVAEILFRAGDVEVALATYERLEQPRDRLFALGEMVAAEPAHIDAAVRAAILELADAVVVDDARGLETLAVVQAAAGDDAGADLTLQEIAARPSVNWKGGDRTDDPTLNPLPADGVLLDIARLQVRAKRFDSALRTVFRIGSGFNRLHLLVHVAEAQAAAGEMGPAQSTFAEAVGLFERLSRAEIHRCCYGTHPLVTAAEALTHGQAKAGQGEQALGTLGRLEVPEGRGDAIQKIVHAASSRGEFGLALRAQSVMRSGRIHEVGCRVEALGYIARALAGLPPGELPTRID